MRDGEWYVPKCRLKPFIISVEGDSFCDDDNGNDDDGNDDEKNVAKKSDPYHPSAEKSKKWQLGGIFSHAHLTELDQ